MTITGLIFDIQRFSLHDGPGIRTTVFFKGCSLRCFWCHNPEGLKHKIEIQFQVNRCIYCGSCVTNCPEHAHTVSEGEHLYNRTMCVTCGECIDSCYADALRIVGRQVTVREVLSEVLADRAFYETSGGGVTLSGGDPALQPEFASELLRACKDEEIHTAIETAGNVPWRTLSKILPYTDLVMMDIKIIDPEEHRLATGMSNELILQNAMRLADSEIPIWIRTPIIPTVNDTIQEILSIAEFISEMVAVRNKNRVESGNIEWELLPFHKLAGDKYRGLGLAYKAGDLPQLSSTELQRLKKVALETGAPIRLSSKA